MLNVAILDDYVNVALESADWSRLPAGSKVTAFDRHLTLEEAARELAPFDVLCTMRERMALPRRLIERLPNLKLIMMVGVRLANLDLEAATEHGVVVCRTPFAGPGPELAKIGAATPELTWGLMIATVRHIASEDRRLREGGWQNSMGMVLEGRTLGLLGLGNIGKRMARYAQAFGMQVIAWSQNLTPEAAEAGGARWVDKDGLFREADILSVHLVLSERSRGLVGARELGLMKPKAYLINTSRGPIVDEGALIATLKQGRIAGAGLDTFDEEPLPAGHPFRSMDNVTLTPHLGYVTHDTFKIFYAGMPDAIAAFAAGAPKDVVNPQVLERARR
ncbi:MAG: D-2-hydroxyacid dehydrogenase family protein [Caulobacteraceae bacterium]|nr:D-2-hydroxyacid dehydrogenase family protein [Caulobacteraceae bacterium]